MKVRLARKVLAVLALLLAVFFVVLGIEGIYFDEPDPNFEPLLSDTGNLLLVLAIAAFPFLGSYILWPK